MRPLRRSHVSKGKSARRFRRHSSRIAAANVKTAPMRGGYRF